MSDNILITYRQLFSNSLGDDHLDVTVDNFRDVMAIRTAWQDALGNQNLRDRPPQTKQPLESCPAREVITISPGDQDPAVDHRRKQRVTKK